MPYLADYDNDGDLDMIFSEVSLSDHTLVLYRNDGKGQFTLTTEAFTGQASTSVLGPWVDYDNNGFLDLFAGRPVAGRFEVSLYRNQGNGNRWLKLTLTGTHSNRSALGAKVRVRATLGGRSVWQLRSIASNLWSEDGGRSHFGLADATQAEEIRIEWPSGNVQTLTNVAADQILAVTEPILFRPEHPVATINGMLTVTNLTSATERQWYFEGAILDGKTNRILTLTNVQPDQAGRYTAVGDFNNDGHVDLFVPRRGAPDDLLQNDGKGWGNGVKH